MLFEKLDPGRGADHESTTRPVACVAKLPALSRPFLPYLALTRLFQFRSKDFDEICPKSRKLANESKTF